MVKVYKKKNFNLYSNHTGEFIIHNTKKEFSNGHTHIRNYNTAKFIINLALYETVPKKKLNEYLYQSIIKISINDDYVNKIKNEIKNLNRNRMRKK